MSGRTVSSAILILVLGSFFATLCDVFIKMADVDVAIFQFTFFRAVFMCLILCPIAVVKYLGSDRSMARLGLKLHFIRGNMWVLAAVLLVISLAELPLATANAVFYTAPIFIMLFGAFFYKERLSVDVVLAAVLGFIGTLVILRPTEITFAMISAILFAIVLAANSLLIKKIPQEQSMLYGLFVTQLFALPMASGLAIWEGEVFEIEILIYAALSSICSILYSLSCLLGYRYVASSKVTSAEYSGLIFAFLLGWWIFGETPDLGVFVGSLFVIMPLLYLSHRDIRRLRKEQLLSNTRSNLGAG
ncbi:DMT family transporter [Marinomonas rhizomae]|uniref:EamA-like transporter family protein n=1 Tax=Marinomonas rhizomae TaxID=491948 RepID=A0A366IVB5_9GAMM|nr:DMT family transporter [Marinomonas rhizomae]RBP78019.1 EamA-like transporter family protein [Marinomonas rhizomae]RNF69254.1 DMT family transporter [Marinomonas rhizomae]